MSRFSVNAEGSFTKRPTLGDVFRSPAGRLLTVAAIWEKGVIFEGGHFGASAQQLLHYTFIKTTEVTYEPEQAHPVAA